MVLSISANRILHSYKSGNELPRSAQQHGAQGDVDAPQKNNASVQVNLSEAARSRLTLSKAVRASIDLQQHTKKAQARERVAKVKQRIDELKKMLIMFGGLAPKALIRELKQLAGELKSAAKDLQDGGSTSSASAGTDIPLTARADAELITNTAAGSANTVEVAAEPTVAEPPEDAQAIKDNSTQTEAANSVVNLQQHMPAADNKARQQRQEDQRQLQETVRELQSLFNMLKAMLRNDDKDKDTEKQLDEISTLIDNTTQSALQLSTEFTLSMDGLG